MALNPFYLIFTLYLVAIFLGFLSGLETEGFYIGNDFHHVSKESYTAAFVLEMIVLVGILLIYRFMAKLKYTSPPELGAFWGYFLFVNQILYMVFVYTTGAGIAGSGFSFNGFNLFNYYFIALNPDLFSFLIIPLVRSKRLALVLLFLLLVSFLMRGWLAGVIYFIALFLIRFYPIVLSIKNSLLLLLSSIAFVAFLPYLISIKWGVRLGNTIPEMFEMAWLNYDFQLLLNSIKSIFERFTHIQYAAYIYENLDSIRVDFRNHEFKHYLQNGILYETYCRIFSNCYPDINSYVVSEYIDPNGKGWNLDIGISGWLFILGLSSWGLIGGWLLLVACIWLLVFKIYSLRYVNLFGVLSLVYFFNSWFSPYYNFLLYLVVFSIIFRMKFLTRRVYVQR